MTATDDRRRIDVLLERVADADLRATLAAEIEEMTSERKFGIVFEKHLPEAIRIRDAPIRFGSTVEYRDGDDRLWQVKRLRAGKALLVRDDETREDVDVAELIVACKLGDPVYPGLRPTGRIERGGDKPHHLVIEGENFHALQTLQYTHRGRVDLIYIDPPYNTGTGDWIYNDKYIGDADAYRHSKWLSFMHRRLELAKDLLAPAGVIIVAIGDHEHHRLRMLLDRVFGERNFLTNVIWQGGSSALAKHTGGGVDYMLMYAKDREQHVNALGQWRVPKEGTEEVLDVVATLWRRSGGDTVMATAELRAWWRANKRRFDTSVSVYDRVDETGRAFFAGDLANGMDRPNLKYDIPHPVTSRPVKRPENGWRHEPERMNANIAAGLVLFGPDETTIPTLKRYLDDYVTQVPSQSFYKDRRASTAHLESVLGSKTFPNPKDVPVLSRWFHTVAPRDAVILDFFAGSGSTAEAVMRLNAQDGGSRRSITVTNNELAIKAASKLRKGGVAPGDPEWEAQGVYRKVTRPRIETVTTGIRPDGSTFSAGFDENVSFLQLTYLDRDDVELGDAYRQVAELLWAKAGGTGGVISELTGDYAIGDHYAVLFNVNAWSRFADEMRERPDVRVAFIVAGSATSYGKAKRALSGDVETYHLYENYLTSFEINTGETI